MKNHHQISSLKVFSGTQLLPSHQIDEMSKILNWGIIGTGRIAKIFARSLKNSKTGSLIAVGSRFQESADKFGQEFKLTRRYGCYEELLSDRDVQAVYIATPHSFHAEWAIKSAKAGKHILCEKPIGINHPEAMAIIEAAYENDVFLMEALAYRCHSQTAKLIELIKRKIIGKVKVIQATFSFCAEFDSQSRLFNNNLGGGGILDVGCYCTSIARLIAGIANGKNFEEPIEVKGIGYIGEKSRVDEYAVASLKFPGGIIAEISAGVTVDQENVVRIFGEEGSITVLNPWNPSCNGGLTKILINKEGEVQEIGIETKEWLYAIEADTVAKNIEARQAPSPAMTWEDTLGNMKTLDLWRSSFGFVYDSEKPKARILPASKRPLAVRNNSKMKYGQIPGIGKSVSRLVMGVDNQEIITHASVMFDDFFERGGNCFDTAWIYGQGSCEKLLGQWIKNRKIREKVVILGKGAHTPFCNPKDLTKQLIESLKRLQTDYLDIYLLHRDNFEIPVAEFIDVLNTHKKAGLIRAFGGSNWSLKRVEEANQYARSKGLTEFSVISNNFSLAQMVQPLWKGCVSSSDKLSRDWFTQTQFVLMAWSSQARGFFTGRAHPDNLFDEELVRCWYSADNFERLNRVNEMARKLNCSPINIALAYVLCQPFPTFALIGPRILSETRTSFLGLDIELTSSDIRWLNLEDLVS
jgi:predicted dehydrogenase/aryl-alcohol dehydrogenase-like predicted oxidoreductase